MLGGRAGFGVYATNDGAYDAPIYTPSLFFSVGDLARDWQATASYTTYVPTPDVITAASAPRDSTAHLGALTVAAKVGPARLGLEGGILSESGFLGLTAGASVSTDLHDKRLTPVLAYHLGDDVLGRPGTSFETAILRFDERLYIDSWGLKSSTTDVRSWHRVARTLHVGPHLRFHAQDGVDFWRRAYVAILTEQGIEVPRYRTPDTNLSPLVAATVGGGLRWTFAERFALHLVTEGSYTQLLDALFTTDRWGFFSTATVELRIE